MASIYKPGRPSTQDPPKAPGAYQLRQNGKLMYQGETNDLARRKGEHIRSGLLPPEGKFAWKQADGRSTSKTRRTHESEKIQQHSPPWNQRGGGGGRKAGI